jgi:hypothetical protein
LTTGSFFRFIFLKHPSSKGTVIKELKDEEVEILKKEQKYKV